MPVRIASHRNTGDYSENESVMKPSDEIKRNDILNSLIANGLRHLERGFESFQNDDLNFSVCDVYFGIEILVKALVFHFQWQLIFSEPGDANIDKLQSGSAHTIGLEQAEKRLKTIILKPLPKSWEFFKRLMKHRNKVVHFYHPGLNIEKEKNEIAVDMANSWTALRQLYKTTEFASVLKNYANDFRTLEAKLLILEQYLDLQEKNIKKSYPEVNILTICPACNRETYYDKCLLCSYHEPSQRDIMQGDEMPARADCPECGEYEGVVNSDNGSRCTACGAGFNSIGTCEYCCGGYILPDENEQFDPENPEPEVGSYYWGCGRCGGRIGYLANKDD